MVGSTGSRAAHDVQVITRPHRAVLKVGFGHFRKKDSIEQSLPILLGLGSQPGPEFPSPAAEPRLYPKLPGDHGFWYTKQGEIAA